MSDANIILTGFMGTGKTSVGREVAGRLGRRFLDLDDMIAQAAGKPVAAIFADDGEPAFRRLEAQACREVAAASGMVVATGGGALLDPANRDVLGSGGVIICLEADPDTILSRVGGNDERPLLAVEDRRSRVLELLSRRRAAYAALPHHLDTSGLTVRAAAERVMGIAAGLPAGGCVLVVGGGLTEEGRRKREEGTEAASATAYRVLIAEGLLAQAGARLREAGLAAARCAVVTNPTVGQTYAAPLTASLRAAGFEPAIIEVPDGEQYKTLDTAAALYDRLAEMRLARDEPIVALGGGVVGDLAGFVAATWLRGVPFAQVPSSLLAMVDASVGGKTGVDLVKGKNLVGAFKQPAVVLMDPDLLASLPEVELRCGLAEMLKAGIVADAGLFAALAAGGNWTAQRGRLQALLADAVRVKADIVERDPLEAGDRAWLNLGHTFGHALELLSGYTLRHGLAVALGLTAAARLGALLGRCTPELGEQIREAVLQCGLPVRHAFDPDTAIAAMGTDKKRRGGGLRFVVPEQIGKVVIVADVAGEAVRAAFQAIR